MDHRPTIGVLGAGAWGTALAILLGRNGNRVKLWGHLTEEIDPLSNNRAHPALPNAPFPESLEPTSDLNHALSAIDELLVVVPSHVFRQVLNQVAPILDSDCSVSWATKGLDPDRGQLLHEVAVEVLGQRPLAVISGPTFAKEVATGLPTALTIASTEHAHSTRLAGYLGCDSCRPYTSSDLIGVEVGGAVKNIMAIAAGIADGLGFGANARAALITRGLAEIMRLGTALGGRQETFMGLAGLGDLVLTCTDNQSRNRQMGLALAKGLSIEAARLEIGQAVEGVGTTREVLQQAQRLKIEMPITEQVYQVLYEQLDPKAAVRALLERQQKAENG
ncbi:MAG: NAD(P)-dependent glycerol-3-phosphate dehydrogenase [Gammaproteobacteria bacterium]|nr:NAD(P)-dependent glycerol-3-phosphate dehydrogenase [Gammaproteobacteria bacterium]